MKYKVIFLFLTLNFITICVYAQKITNITAEQVGQTIQISYNLEIESPCTISLFYSTDNGASWQGPLIKVSGDVGEKISNGNKKITWDVLNEMEQLKFSSVVFKVDARKIGLKEVKIGNQIWSAENLNTDRFANGELIPEAKSNYAWLEAGKNQKAVWCYKNNDSSIGVVYGKLYNWYAVTDSRGLCPIGWHAPAEVDFKIITSFLGGDLVAGGKMKSTSDYWAAPNEGASNISGFTGMPGGCRYLNGEYAIIGLNLAGYWWTSSGKSLTEGLYFILNWGDCEADWGQFDKADGLSVRCIKD